MSRSFITSISNLAFALRQVTGECPYVFCYQKGNLDMLLGYTMNDYTTW